jgi:hypothetical protein
MTPEEKAAAIGSQFPAGGIQYSYQGIVFHVFGCEVIGPMVRVSIVAWTGAGQNRAYLPLGDGIFQFVNPPLTVPDGFDQHGRPTGFSRNDLAAAQQMVYDGVTGCATTNGWVAP